MSEKMNIADAASEALGVLDRALDSAQDDNPLAVAIYNRARGLLHTLDTKHRDYTRADARQDAIEEIDAE